VRGMALGEARLIKTEHISSTHGPVDRELNKWMKANSGSGVTVLDIKFSTACDGKYFYSDALIIYQTN
jgi:hypothetical protein